MKQYFLEELLQIKNGRDHKHLPDGNIPVYGSGGFMRFVNQAIYNDESILLPRKGTLSNIQFTNKPFWTVDTIYYTIINKERANPLYLYHYLKQLDLSYLNSGTGVPSMTFGVYYGIKVQLPSLSNQQKIAKVLSDLDAKIELNNKINTELEAMAKTLYDYWFVQFDFPNEEGKPYKSSGGKMIWNEELKRDIPEGWEVKYLSNICEIINGYAFKSEWYTDSGIKIIRTKNFENGYVDLNDLVYLDNEFAKQFEKFLLKTYDFLMVMVGASTGKYCTVNSNILPALQNQNMWRFISKIENQQLFLNLKLQRIVLELENTTNGSARGFFQKDSFLSKLIEIPNQDLIEDFCIKINSVFKRIDNNLKENQELASLRDWLLPMLMNGQVSVTSKNSAQESYEVEDTALGMVAEPAEELKSKNQKQAKVITLKASNVDIYKRTLLAAEIVYQLHNEATLGHLKLQKLLYLCQEINNMSLPMNFLKQAMGPYDNRLMRSLDKQLEEKRWFKFEKTEFLKYKPLGAVGSHQNDYQKYFEADKTKIDYLITTFRKYKSQDIEAVVTLYACWKEAIENKELINLELILKKFYSWSKEKEKFNPDDLKKHLNWMKNNGIYPR